VLTFYLADGGLCTTFLPGLLKLRAEDYGEGDALLFV